MSFFELINKRQSCRSFDTEPVDDKLLKQIIEAARLSPSACNSQPWFFTVANGDKAKSIAPCVQDMGMNKFASDCPAFIVISETRANLKERVGQRFGEREFSSIDIGLATAHLCLAASELGLSTCILGWLNEEKIKKIINTDNRIRLVIAVGYAKTDEIRDKKRKDTDEISRFL